MSESTCPVCDRPLTYPTQACRDFLDGRECHAECMRAALSGEVSRLTRELEEANHWRKRHCEEADMHAAKVVELWNENRALTARCEAAERLNDEWFASMQEAGAMLEAGGCELHWRGPFNRVVSNYALARAAREGKRTA